MLKSASTTNRAKVASIAGLGLLLGLSSMMTVPTFAFADTITSQQSTTNVLADETPAKTVTVATFDELVAAVRDAPTDGSLTLIEVSSDATPDDMASTADSSAMTIAEGQNILLNLGGKRVAVDSRAALGEKDDIDSKLIGEAGICNYGTLTIENGTLSTSVQGDLLQNYGTLTIRDDGTHTTKVTCSASKDATNLTKTVNNLGGNLTISGSKVTVDNTFNHPVCIYGGDVVIDNATINATATGTTAVGVFNEGGTNDGAPANVVITGEYARIRGQNYAVSTNNMTSAGSNVTILDGILTGYYFGVYWPSSGHLVIGDEATGEGPQINATGGSAVEVKCGTVDIYGGKLTGSGSSKDYNPMSQEVVDYIYSLSAAHETGDALTVIANAGGGYDMSPLVVNVHGGELISKNAYAIRYMSGLKASDKVESESTSEISVNGGTFTGKSGIVNTDFAADGTDGIFEGGTYQTEQLDEVGQHLADGYAFHAGGDGTFVVSDEQALLDAGKQYVVRTDDYSVYFDTLDAGEQFVEDSGDTGLSVAEVTFDVTFNPMLTNVEPVIVSDILNGTSLSELTVPSFTCDGYTFNGWYLDENYTTPADLETMAVLGGDVTLYAKWIPDGSETPDNGEDVKPVNPGMTTDDATDDVNDSTNADGDSGAAHDGTVNLDDKDEKSADDIIQTGVEYAAPAAAGIGSMLAGIGAFVSRRIGRRK